MNFDPSFLLKEEAFGQVLSSIFKQCEVYRRKPYILAYPTEETNNRRQSIKIDSIWQQLID